MLALPYEKPRYEGGEAESDYYEEEFPEEIIEEKDNESKNSDLDFGVQPEIQEDIPKFEVNNVETMPKREASPSHEISVDPKIDNEIDFNTSPIKSDGADSPIIEDAPKFTVNKVSEDDEEDKETDQATEFGESELAYQDKMYKEMDMPDGLHVDDPFDGDEEGQPQVAMTSLLNFRDWKGRTPLHFAVMFNNKAACESLLFLKANPHIEDAGGYRPLDYADKTSPICRLLKNWMQRTSAPISMHPFTEPLSEEEKKEREMEKELQKKKMMGSVGQKMKTEVKKEEKKIEVEKKKKEAPVNTMLSPQEIKNQSIETLSTKRLNDTQDTYYQATVKAKLFESARLLKNMVAFPICYQNGIGNTVLHNAISTQDCRYVKLVVTEEFEDKDLEFPNSLQSIKGNFRKGLAQCFLIENSKGFTPLAQAIEC